MGQDQWWDEALNIVYGCSNGDKICAVHADCWARGTAKRFNPDAPFDVPYLVEDFYEQLDKVDHRRAPRYFFVENMSDMFCEGFTDFMRAHLWECARNHLRHTFMALTKRPERIDLDFDCTTPRPHNFWLGVSVCRPEEVSRIYTLKERWPGVRFVSFEPLMGPITDWAWLPLVDWVIIGGRSGAHKLNCKTEPELAHWVLDITKHLHGTGIPIWFKDNLKYPYVGGHQRPPHTLRR